MNHHQVRLLEKAARIITDEEGSRQKVSSSGGKPKNPGHSRILSSTVLLIIGPPSQRAGFNTNIFFVIQYKT